MKRKPNIVATLVREAIDDARREKEREALKKFWRELDKQYSPRVKPWGWPDGTN